MALFASKVEQFGLVGFLYMVEQVAELLAEE